jgi:hypothetical protein
MQNQGGYGPEYQGSPQTTYQQPRYMNSNDPTKEGQGTYQQGYTHYYSSN